jgi:putative endonuclease
MYYAYILKSTVDGTLYKGNTGDLKERLEQHNAGKSAYTSRKGPWILVYSEEFETRAQALQREKYFKSAAGRRFIAKLNL